MAHITLAASEGTFVRLFEPLRDGFVFAKADSGDFGSFSAGYTVEAHLAGGTLDLRADNTVSVKELDIKWDKLDLWLSIDIPQQCVGGFCILPLLFGCALHAPKICIFTGSPDITLPLHLDNLITSEISITGSLKLKYFIDPGRQPWMDDWDAAEQSPSVANRWQLFVDPQTIDVDVFDIADIVGDLLQNAANAAVDTLLSWLPNWAKSILKGILSSAIDLIKDILDLPDDLQEWISDLLNVSFGLLDSILTAVAEYFASRAPVYQFEDPYTILPGDTNPNGVTPPQLVPVKIPLHNINVFNDDQEMVLEANVE